MQAATIAYFVPFVSERTLGPAEGLASLHELPLWQELRGAPCAERRLWFGGPALADAWLTAPAREAAGFPVCRGDSVFVWSLPPAPG